QRVLAEVFRSRKAFRQMLGQVLPGVMHGGEKVVVRGRRAFLHFREAVGLTDDVLLIGATRPERGGRDHGLAIPSPEERSSHHHAASGIGYRFARSASFCSTSARKSRTSRSRLAIRPSSLSMRQTNRRIASGTRLS